MVYLVEKSAAHDQHKTVGLLEQSQNKGSRDD